MNLRKGFKLVSITLLVLLVSLGITLTLLAKSEAELEDLAANELAPEVRQAAGMALASYWESKTIEELEEISTTSNADGLRIAAGGALSRLYLMEDKSYDELVEIACGGATAELRGAAIDPLVKNLIEVQNKTADEVKELALNGECSEIRAAGAEAYFQLASSQYRDPSALVAVIEETSEAFGADANDEIKALAARLLGGAWVGYGFITKEEAEQKVLDRDENPFVREAAGRALYIFWAREGKSADELWKLAVENTSIAWKAPYRNAITLALAYAYGQDC